MGVSLSSGRSTVVHTFASALARLTNPAPPGDAPRWGDSGPVSAPNAGGPCRAGGPFTAPKPPKALFFKNCESTPNAFAVSRSRSGSSSFTVLPLNQLSSSSSSSVHCVCFEKNLPPPPCLLFLLLLLLLHQGSGRATVFARLPHRLRPSLTICPCRQCVGGAEMTRPSSFPLSPPPLTAFS